MALLIARTLFCLYFIIYWLFLGIGQTPSVDYVVIFHLKADVLIYTHIRNIITKSI